MSLLTTPWDFRLLLALLPLQTKLYLIFLLTVVFYSAISSCLILAKTSKSFVHTHLAQDICSQLAQRLGNLRQLHLLLFLLFGIFLTDGTFRALQTLVRSRMSLGEVSIDQIIDPLLCFSFVVLSALTFLHALQWLASSRLQQLPSTRAQ
jgi:hypothetical protein